MPRTLRRHWDVVHLAKPPLVVQKIVMAALSVVAWLFRYPSEYAYPFAEVTSRQDRMPADAPTRDVSHTQATSSRGNPTA